VKTYRNGEFWGDGVVNGTPYKVSPVAVSPADWRFAVFPDDDHFDAGGK
jgi:hypothetical protein